MAIALVGSLGGVSVTPTFGQATTAGNLLICWIHNPGGTSISFTGTGWTQAGGGATDVVQVWYRANCGAGESAPTINGGFNNAQLGEFSGADTASPLETDSGSPASSATSPVTDTCSATDAVSGNLVVSVGLSGLSKSGTDTTSITLTGGSATAAGNANNDATSTTNHYRFVYGITTTNTSADAARFSSASMNLTSVSVKIASFKPQALSSVPRNPAINHSATALLAWIWRREPDRIRRTRVDVLPTAYA